MMRLDVRTLSKLSTVHRCTLSNTSYEMAVILNVLPTPIRIYCVYTESMCDLFFTTVNNLSSISLANNRLFLTIPIEISVIVFVRRWQINSRAKEIANWFATMSFGPNMQWFLWKCPKNDIPAFFEKCASHSFQSFSCNFWWNVD